MVAISLKRIKSTTIADVTGEAVPIPPGLYRSSRVRGDYSSLTEAAQSGVDFLVKVRVSYGSTKEVLLFSRETTIEVPPKLLIDSSDGERRRVSKRADILELVVDTKGRTISNIRVKLVETTLDNS